MVVTLIKTRSLLLEAGPLAGVAALLCCKLVYFSALLPGQWWLAMNDWWLTDQDPITGWIRSPVQILGAIQARPHILSATLASLLILFAPLFLVPRVGRLAALLALDLFFTVLGMSEFLHYRFYGDVMSISDLWVAHQLPTIAPSVQRQLHPVDAIYFLDMIAAVLLLPLYVRACRRIPGLQRRDTARLCAGLLVVGPLLAAPTAALVQHDEDGLFGNKTLRYEVASAIGILPYHLLDLVDSLRPGSGGIRQEEVEQVRQFLDAERQNEPVPSELFGIARRRNVILMSAESLQAFPIGLEVDGQPIAPRLAAFAGESLHYVNFYDQTHLATTSDAEFMALNSLHPLPARTLANQYPENDYRALPAILSEHEYATLSAVAATSDIWDMHHLHPRYGFRQSFFEESYEVGERFGQWVSDREFFSQTVPFLEAQPEPFLAFLLSSANHHPYPVPERYRVLKLGELEGTLLGDYLNSVHYLDQVFGEFVDSLRERGLLDKSVFVLYGDHQGFLGDPPELARLLGFPERSEYDYLRVRKKVPFFIRLPHGEAAGVRDVAAGHLDIAPTILGLLGIKDERSVMLGRDLTRDAPSLVVFRNGSFADEMHYFINVFGPTSASSCYEVETGQKLDCVPLDGRRREARRRLEISDLIIEGNLIPTLTAGRGPRP
jgi:lipoteichoic acid synthase